MTKYKRRLRSKQVDNETLDTESSQDELLSDLLDVKMDTKSASVFCNTVKNGCQVISSIPTKTMPLRKRKSSNVTTFITVPATPTSNAEILHLEACRICLHSRCRLFPINKYELAEMYRLVTGLPLADNDGLPQRLCVECATLVTNCQRLRVRSHRAHELLARLLENGQLTLENIEKIDRKSNKLTSKLGYQYLGPDSFNEQYIFDDDQINELPNVTVANKVVEDEIKEEIEPLNTIEDDFIDQNEYSDPIDVSETDQTPLATETIPKPTKTHKLKERTELKTKKRPKVKKVKLKKGLKKKLKKYNVSDELKKGVKPSKLLVLNDEPKKVKKPRKKADKTLTEVQKKMDEYFTVTIFKSLEEKIEELQRRKENASYMNAPLKCQYCYQGYLDHDTYDLHMHKHTDNYGDFVCSVCQYRCPSKERLRQHLYFRHSRKFHCKVCRFESHDKYRATLHMRFHEGKTYKCKHCEKVFNHLVNLHNHLRAKHPTDNVCEMCGYSFIGERGLKTHRSLTHGHDIREIPADAPSCDECKVRFISEEALQMHLKVSSRHGNTVENFKKRNYHQLHRSLRSTAEASKPKKERDSKITRKRDGIRTEKREIRLTKFDEPVPCEKCGVGIPSASEYHYHFKRSHPNEKRSWYPTDTHPHLCDVCGKMLRNNALKDHMLEHVDGVTFKCDTCGKKFNKKFNMKLHARVHLGERYPCVVCGKLFNHMGNRDRHLKYVHTESKDFKCEFCEKSFKNDGARKLHTNHVHLRKPYPKRNRQREGQIDANRRRPKETNADENMSTFRRDCSDLWE